MRTAIFFAITLAVGSLMDVAGIAPPLASTFEWWVGLNLLAIVYALVRLERALASLQQAGRMGAPNQSQP
jgi:hypothetical protein